MHFSIGSEYPSHYFLSHIYVYRCMYTRQNYINITSHLDIAVMFYSLIVDQKRTQEMQLTITIFIKCIISFLSKENENVVHNLFWLMNMAHKIHHFAYFWSDYISSILPEYAYENRSDKCMSILQRFLSIGELQVFVCHFTFASIPPFYRRLNYTGIAFARYWCNILCLL